MLVDVNTGVVVPTKLVVGGKVYVVGVVSILNEQTTKTRKIC